MQAPCAESSMVVLVIAGGELPNFLIALLEITSGDVYINLVGSLSPLSISGDKSVSPHRLAAFFFCAAERLRGAPNSTAN